jgi:lysine N6-hydroxylase
MRSPAHSFIGIGAGPANLSLAALAQPIPGLHGRVLERAHELVWHAGLLLPQSRLQTSFLKDLVTPVDPTNPCSFVAYLVAHGRLYPFLTARFPQVLRAEFSDYLAWVARRLPSVELGCTVEAVDVDARAWHVQTSRGPAHASDLVLGTGRAPWVPEPARGLLGRAVFHASELTRVGAELAGRRVAIVGGGQSGAEVVQHALRDSHALPSQLLWIGRRASFSPLDDSPFANEWFTPAYSEHFHGLASAERQRLVEQQVLASDGVTSSLLEEIYRRIYELRFVERRNPSAVRLWPGHELVGLERGLRGLRLELRAAHGLREEWADVVVLATGYRWVLPPCLEPLRSRIAFEGDEPVVRADFSVVWDGPAERRLFVQNASRAQRGVADPNLSLMAWRSACIANALAGREVYRTGPRGSFIDWCESSTEDHGTDGRSFAGAR